MALAPEISAFGDGDHVEGETGLTIDGGGFGAFPGSVWMYESADRTGEADELTVGAWNDIQLTGVEIPASPNNSAGTAYLFVQREDLAWSQGFEFTLGDAGALPTGIEYDINGSYIPLIGPDATTVFTPSWADELPVGVTLSSVVHTLPSPLIKGGESSTAATSSVRIGGARHGNTYLIQCAATLSNGETINRQFPLRCFNG